LVHGAAAERRWRWAIDRNEAEPFRDGLAVERPPETVENPSQQARTHAHLERASGGFDGVVRADSVQVTERKCERSPLVERDDFRAQRGAATPNEKEVTDPASRDRHSQKHAAHPDYRPDWPERRGPCESSAKRLDVHGADASTTLFALFGPEVRGFVSVKIAVPFLVLALLSSCRAQLKAEGSASARASGVDAEGSASGSASTRTDDSADSAWADSPAGASAADGAVPVGSGEPALLGARHDLRLSVERATNQCQCLNVALGEANLPAFRWKAGAPSLDPGSQLVIAMSSEGQTCEGEPKDSLGASYWGYRVSGNDVVVLVESSGRGRPLTAGGIIPKPFGDGQVFVAPAGKKTPYGRAKDGGARCKLGNPGAPRTAPLDPLEGGSAPDDTNAP
jgi:hypothetical protein